LSPQADRGSNDQNDRSNMSVRYCSKHRRWQSERGSRRVDRSGVAPIRVIWA